GAEIDFIPGVTEGAARGQVDPAAVDLPPPRMREDMAGGSRRGERLNRFAQGIAGAQAGAHDGAGAPAVRDPGHARKPRGGHPDRRKTWAALELPVDQERAGGIDAVV